MAKNEVQLGEVRRVSGFATGVRAGELVADNGWVGVVQKDVTGTTETFTNPHGRSPSDGELGDGIGDIKVVGVHKVVDEDYPSSPLSVGDKVKIGTTTTVGTGITTASGVKASAAAGDGAGHVWSIDGVEDGVRYVNVKLLGAPSTDTDT